MTTVDLGSAEVQLARGSEMTDADGSRTATLLTTPGTAAHLVLPDGSTRPLRTLSIGATEYTVGPNGPKAMPAELPPASAYTYCVELTADEALAAGAAELRFDRPQHFYVEDFLGFPVGSAVPAGFFDPRAARWIASANGRVVQVLGATARLGRGQPMHPRGEQEMLLAGQPLVQLQLLGQDADPPLERDEWAPPPWVWAA